MARRLAVARALLAGAMGGALLWAVPAASPAVQASVAVAPRHLPAYGGTLTVRWRVQGATECTLSVRPYVADLAGRVWCSGHTAIHEATVGIDPSARSRRLLVQLRVRGPDGVLLRTSVVRQSAPSETIRAYTGVSSYGLYGNAGTQAVGDCTVATVADLLQTWTASAPLEQQPFLDVYTTLVGGPGGADDGLEPATVLDYWEHTGIDGTRIRSWSAIPSYRSRSVIEAELDRYGALYGDVVVPTTDLQLAASSSSAAWTVVTTPAGMPVAARHAVAIVGYDAFGPYLATWGYVQHVSWGWWAVWAAGADTVVPLLSAWSPNVAPTSATITAAAAAL